MKELEIDSQRIKVIDLDELENEDDLIDFPSNTEVAENPSLA